MQTTSPLSVFVYNRPEHTRLMLDSLSACARLDECQVYIFSDSPRVPEHEENVQKVRSLIREWGGMHHAKIVERVVNLGLARSIVDGVTQLCNEYGRVIVLEDDLILHPAFIDFMLQSLDRYVDDERVAQIAGFTFPIKTNPKPDALFLPLTTSWGWATWDRAWKSFSWDLKSAAEALSTDPALRKRFDLDGTYPYYEMLLKTTNGTIDSWAIRWYWQTFIQNKLTLYPRQSLVWQNGFDESATHTRSSTQTFQGSYDAFMQRQFSESFVFPSAVEMDEVICKRLKQFMLSAASPSMSKRFFSRVKTKLAR